SLKDSDGSQLLELTIKKAVTSDSGQFVCLATNPHGASDSQFTVVVEDVPGAPTGVRVRDSDSRHVLLSWSLPLEQSTLKAPVLSYVIAY
ncbi:Fibronectin type III, partial [Trinorchestia longiramus]